jgi:lambda family phage portal protein
MTKTKQTRILDWTGNPIKAAYADSAESTRLNTKHWARAQSGDFNTLISGDLPTLRRRARYEMLNNSYAGGIADTLAFDIVGSGPTPQVNSGNEPFDQELEERFIHWMANCDYGRQMDLAEILQSQLALQQCEAGVSVTVLKRETAKYDVSLRLLCVDIDRMDTLAGLGDPNIRNGIEFDQDGRPCAYYIKKYYPAGGLIPYTEGADRISDSDVVYLYRIKRPGQMDGVPWFTPCLDKFASFRRFADATMDAAENAASHTGVLHTKDNIIDDDDHPDSNNCVPVERGTLLVLPDGYEMSQFDPKHPATTYEMFKAETLNEISRCVLMPYNVAAMNSSKYNYASGRLDHQKYHRMICVIRNWGEKRFLNRVFAAWLSEAYLIENYFTSRPTWEQAMKAIATIKWFWPGFEHVDPVKEADAENTKLANGTMTIADSYAARGQDWRRKMEQRAKELAYQKDLENQYGITLPTPGTKEKTIIEDLTDEDN